MLEEFENLMEEVWIGDIWVTKALQEMEDRLWEMRKPLEQEER